MALQSRSGIFLENFIILTWFSIITFSFQDTIFSKSPNLILLKWRNARITFLFSTRRKKSFMLFPRTDFKVSPIWIGKLFFKVRSSLYRAWFHFYQPSDYISSVVVIFWKFPSLMIFNLYRRCYKPEATDATIKRNTLLPVNQTDGAIL